MALDPRSDPEPSTLSGLPVALGYSLNSKLRGFENFKAINRGVWYKNFQLAHAKQP